MTKQKYFKKKIINQTEVDAFTQKQNECLKIGDVEWVKKYKPEIWRKYLADNNSITSLYCYTPFAYTIVTEYETTKNFVERISKFLTGIELIAINYNNDLSECTVTYKT